MSAPQLTDFDTLTFDCYGTLIDWESGIYEALKPWLEREGVGDGRDAVLQTFARFESGQQAATPDMLYPRLLAHVHKGLSGHWNITSTDADADAFGASVPDWPAFADSRDALAYLKGHYRLVILSNVDRQSFQGSNARLEIEFDAVFTAQDVGSYKPDPANFAYMLRGLAAMGIDKEQILHTAQSLFHDHVPACDAGLATNWIDRRHDQPGWGATAPPPSEVTTDFRHHSMADFVRAHQACLAQ